MRREQHMYEQWDDQDMRAQMGLAYLIGTLGTATVVVLAFVVVMQSGWLDELPSTLRHLNVRGLPNVVQTQVSGVFRGLTDHVASTGSSATAMWQRGSEPARQLSSGAPPPAPGRSN